MYGIFTVAFLVWWVPTSLVEMIAMYATIGLMWVPWLIAVPYLGRKKWNPQPATVTGAVGNVVLTAIRVGLVVGFWIL